MLADTDAIRSLGVASAALSSDLADLAAEVSAVTAPELGEVGARFHAALAAATADLSRSVATLSHRATAAAGTAAACADGYEQAEGRNGVRFAVPTGS